MKNNRIVVDLSKCQWAWRSWTTKCGNYKRTVKPINPTVHGQEFDCNAPAFGNIYRSYYGSESDLYKQYVKEKQTMLERATSLHLLDEWIPCVTFEVTANHRLTYTGEKAEVMWKAWNERIFNKKKGK